MKYIVRGTCFGNLPSYSRVTYIYETTSKFSKYISFRIIKTLI